MRGWTRRWIGRQDGIGRDIRSGTLLERLLAARGLTDEAARSIFERPTLKQLHHPSTLPGATDAAVRLVEAVRAGRSVAIFGDYDVDGIMSSAILYHAITLVQDEEDLPPRLYVPHRIHEGYGLNVEAIERLAAEGVGLIISVDCGVTAFEVCDRARELGVELIISDHHAFARTDDGAVRIPEPDLLVHPMRPDAPAPFTELCGAGVALKIAWAFFERWCSSRKLWEPQRSRLLDLFGYAALATIADVVPLVGENRVIVSEGLKLVPHCSHLGLRSLLEACGFKGSGVSLTVRDVGFRIGPVLNAAGRLGSAEEALALMTTAPAEEAKRIADDLVKLNRKRQDLCKATTEEAIELVAERGFDDPERRAIVLAEEHWDPGLVGICCSRLAERFGRPVILMQKGASFCRGSARSIHGFSVHGALVECANLMNAGDGSAEPLVFGGHDAAAGMTVPTSRYDEFVEHFVRCANAAITPNELVPAVEVDLVARLEEVNPSVIRRIEQMGPFGAGNPHPRLILEGVAIMQPVKMGKTGQHLKARISSGGRSEQAVWWQSADLLEDFQAVSGPGHLVDLIVEPKINRWNNREDIQFEIKDARLHTPADLAEV